MIDDPAAVARLRAAVKHALGLKWVSALNGLARDAGWTLPNARCPSDHVLVAAFDEALPKETALFRNEVYWPAIASTNARTVWSAGCATGEEAFSIALVLPKARVVATDVARSAIAVAKTGIVRPLQLAKLSASRRGLIRPNGSVSPDVLSRIEFRVHNLARDPYPAPFDLIVCRNVLVYMEPDAKARIVERFSTALCPGGFLLLSSADSMARVPAGLERQRIGEVLFYRRS